MDHGRRGETGRPKVLFVAPVSYFKGGAEVVLTSMLANPLIDAVLAVPEEGPLAEAARALGVTVCCYHPGAMTRVHRPPRPGPIVAAVLDAVRCAFRLRRLAQEHGCDLLHSNGLKPHVLCAILGVTRTRTLVHLHDIPHKRAERVIWRVIARCVTRVILVSRPCFPGPLPRNVEVVPNGITPVADSLPEGGPGEPVRLGFVGRFHPNKGLDLLLDWFKAVRQTGLAATLTIRGRPDPDMPEYWERIRGRISAEALEPATTLDGWVAGKAAYDGLDVLLVTSEIPDPAPLVVPEAMSAGVVVAGYPAGGVALMIADGETGLLARDGPTLAAKLHALVEDKPRFRALREAAFAHVRTVYAIPGFHQRLLDVYERIIR